MDGGTEKTAWEIYNARAEIADKELIRDWNESLNTLLIFAALYSAILTAFIIESMKLLQEDMQESTRDILLVLSRQLANASTPAVEHESFTPEAWAVRVNYYFFTSISCSLVAALGAVLALQWVGSYDIGLIRSSPKLRATQRQLRFDGAEKWKLGQIVSTLPLLIFASLFLMFVGLADWLWHIHQRIACVIIAGAGVAGLFYAVSHLISMLDASAPFRTPISRSLPYAAQSIHSWILFVVRYSLHWLQERKIPEETEDEHTRQGLPLRRRPAFRRTFTHQREKLLNLSINLRKIIATLHNITITPSIPLSFEQRERQILESHEYVQRDGILWLARNLEDTPASRPSFVSLLKEAITLPVEQLMAPEMDAAPWGAIFRNVLQGHGYLGDLLSEVPQQELIAILDAAALVGSHGHLSPDLNLLCYQITESSHRDLNTSARLAAWRNSISGSGLAFEGEISSLILMVQAEPLLILKLSDQMVYMIMHRFWHQPMSGRAGKWAQRGLVELLTPLMGSNPSFTYRRLTFSMLALLMALTTPIHQAGNDTYTEATWHRYREALLDQTEIQLYYLGRRGRRYRLPTPARIIYHSVILLQWAEHARDSIEAKKQLFYSMMRVAEVKPPAFEYVRVYILRFLADQRIAWDEQTLQLVGSVASSTIQLYDISPAEWWVECLTQYDQLLAENETLLTLVVALLIRAAEATGYPTLLHNQPATTAMVHPAILIIASMILPNQYSLGPLKDMPLSSLLCQNRSWRELLCAWVGHYQRPANGDSQAECILLVEFAKMSSVLSIAPDEIAYGDPAGFAIDYAIFVDQERTMDYAVQIVRYISRQADKQAYWECIVTDHLGTLLSARNLDSEDILCKIHDVSQFPSAFFEAGGRDWLFARSYRDRERRDMTNLVAACIRQSNSIRVLRQCLELASGYLKSAHNSWSYISLVSTFSRLLNETGSLPPSEYSTGMRSMATQGWPSDVRAEMQTLLNASRRRYLISPLAEGYVRLVRDPDGLCCTRE